MAIRIGRTINIEAPPEVVWRVMVDVEKWPEWTASMRKIERMDEGEFGLGSKARVAARGAPPSIWTVTEFVPGRSFTWEANTGAATAVAAHVIEAAGEGSRVTLSLVITGGVLLTLFGPLFAAYSRRNVRLEAEGLKRRSEELTAASA